MAGTDSSLAARLATGPPLVLDGATGTELERRGVRCDLPLWSARALWAAPEVVQAIHRDYVAAGAEALVANTFRTQRRVLARGGLADSARELTARAIGLARRAADAAGRRVLVFGTAPPLEDCFRPDLVASAEELAAEHAEHAENLAAAGADAILLETHHTIREAAAALRAAGTVGLPVIASFACGAEGRLLSGEPLAAALALAAELGAVAVGVNCLPPGAVEACLPALADAELPFGVQANLGAPGATPDARRSADCSPDEYAEHARHWLAAGAVFVGGCCGTRPDHVRALAGLLAARR